MENIFIKHIINIDTKVVDALKKLDSLAEDALLFIIDDDNKLVASVSDGDIRRGLINGVELTNKVYIISNKNPKSIVENKYSLDDIIFLRDSDFRIVPVINENQEVKSIINFRLLESYLPIDAVIMAGGLGSRLMPLTRDTPKPLLKIHNKAVIDYNIDRLSKFGITSFHVSVRYLGDQIKIHLSERMDSGNFNIYHENEPMGTLGSVSLIDRFVNDTVLVTNSDIITDLNYEDFYRKFNKSKADVMVATVPYKVEVPFGVLELNGNIVAKISEKPQYIYECNAGIYLFKKRVLEEMIVENRVDTPDFLNSMINNGLTVSFYRIKSYWLDIGRMSDFEKAKSDVLDLDL